MVDVDAEVVAAVEVNAKVAEGPSVVASVVAAEEGAEVVEVEEVAEEPVQVDCEENLRQPFFFV